ncbi:MAG: flavodoxin family protein [Syntrophaceae bacterium]|nr:flavodoxin family protein [Syntrophaceae bacterium]
MNASVIKLLGISGSPRVASTDFAVKTALSYSKERYQVETDYYTVHKKEINFCIHCDYCIRKKEGCIHKDDMQELYPKLEWANAWILASPVYQGNVSGQLKAILDRCRALVAKNPKIFENKVGAGIAVGGDRTGGQDPTLQTIIDFYIINEMIPVGGGSFGANLGAAIWSKDKGAKGAEADEEGLGAVRRIVDRMIKVSSLIHR